MSRARRKQGLMVSGVVIGLCLCALTLKTYRASAAEDHAGTDAATPAAHEKAPAAAEEKSANGLANARANALANPSVESVPAAEEKLAGIAAAPASPSPSPTPIVQMLKVWMYGGYFYPRTIYAKPGQTLIVVRNQSQADVTLALLPYGASSSSAVTVSTQNQTNSSAGGAPPIVASGVVNLSAGQYIYYDQANPALQGVIVVQPN